MMSEYENMPPDDLQDVYALKRRSIIRLNRERSLTFHQRVRLILLMEQMNDIVVTAERRDIPLPMWLNPFTEERLLAEQTAQRGKGNPRYVGSAKLYSYPS